MPFLFPSVILISSAILFVQKLMDASGYDLLKSHGV